VFDDPKRKTQEATVRFKSIITLTVDGQPREFSNVMQVYYRGIGKSLLGYATRSKSWGEAIVIDLGKRGRAYVLPTNFSRTNSFGNVYPHALLQTVGINTSVGGMKDEQYKILQSVTGRHTYKYENSMVDLDIIRPLIVGFKDEADPNSIFEIKYDALERFLGAGVKYKSFELEITDNPITEGRLIKRLTWLNDPTKQCFQRSVDAMDVDDLPPREEWPLKWFMTCRKLYLPSTYDGISYD